MYLGLYVQYNTHKKSTIIFIMDSRLDLLDLIGCWMRSELKKKVRKYQEVVNDK